MKKFLVFNNKDCEQYLNISAENLVYKLDNQPQFNELTCDLAADGYVIASEDEDLYTDLLQFITDTYKDGDTEAFLSECCSDSDTKKLTYTESEELNKSINTWQEETSDYLMANFTWIKYCVPQRESSFDDLTISNYIKFPKAANGSMLSDTKLAEIIESLYTPDEDNEDSYKIFGTLEEEPQIVDTPDAKYIVWNQVRMEDYDALPGHVIDKLYRY
jgi:hypothetical protein